MWKEWVITGNGYVCGKLVCLLPQSFWTLPKGLYGFELPCRTAGGGAGRWGTKLALCTHLPDISGLGEASTTKFSIKIQIHEALGSFDGTWGQECLSFGTATEERYGPWSRSSSNGPNCWGANGLSIHCSKGKFFLLDSDLADWDTVPGDLEQSLAHDGKCCEWRRWAPALLVVHSSLRQLLHDCEGPHVLGLLLRLFARASERWDCSST